MTWFGWALVVLYGVSCAVTVADKAKRRDGSGAARSAIVAVLLICGVLIIGTGTGV